MIDDLTKPTEVENFHYMKQIQAEYDAMVFKAHGLDGYQAVPAEALRLAIIDELGEFNHELKSRWCWWKKTQKPEDMEKVVEELMDVLHFVLMKINAGRISDLTLSKGVQAGRQLYRKNPDGEPLSLQYSRIQQNATYNNGQGLGVLFEMLNLSPEAVFEAYKAKNQINRERVRGNY